MLTNIQEEFNGSEEDQKPLEGRFNYQRTVGSTIDGGALTMSKKRRKELIELLKKFCANNDI